MTGEESRCKEGIDGNLGSTGHKRREQNSESTVAFAGKSSASHNARNGTTEANQQGHNASSRQAQASEQPVHHESDTSHIACIFEHAEEEEQNDNEGKEDKHSSYARIDAVDDERMNGWSDIPLRQEFVGKSRKAVYSLLKDVLQPSSYRIESEVENRCHNEQEGRNGCVAARQDFVYSDASPLFVALFWSDNCLLTDLQDEAEPHIGKGGTAVKASLLLHLADDMLDGFLLVLSQIESRSHEFVAFNQLACGKTDWYVSSLSVILDEMHDGVKATMDCSTMFLRTAKVLSSRPFMITGHMDGMPHNLVHALVFHGADGNDRNAENPFHSVDTNGSTITLHLVHHIESQHHRYVELHQLHGQIEVAFDVRGINDIDDPARITFQDEATTDDLFARVRTEAVNARKIGHDGIRMAFDNAVFSVDCHTRKVADMLLATRQLIEKSRLSTVLIADESKGETSLFCR